MKKKNFDTIFNISFKLSAPFAELKKTDIDAECVPPFIPILHTEKRRKEHKCNGH